MRVDVVVLGIILPVLSKLLADECKAWMPCFTKCLICRAIAWMPEDVSVDEDVVHAIELTIRRLKPREREFLRLHYYEDLDKEEIARRIGIDAERVRLLKHRSLKSFREIYERLRKTVDTKRR